MTWKLLGYRMLIMIVWIAAIIAVLFTLFGGFILQWIITGDATILVGLTYEWTDNTQQHYKTLWDETRNKDSKEA